MKFSKGDVVRRVLPSGTMVGGLMVVTSYAGGKFVAVRDIATGKKNYVDRSERLKKEGKTTKIMISEDDMDKIDAMKGVGAFYHIVSPVYDRLYANQSKFVCFILANKGKTIHRVFKLGEVSRVLRKVDEIRKGYEIVPVKQPMYKLQLIGEL